VYEFSKGTPFFNFISILFLRFYILLLNNNNAAVINASGFDQNTFILPTKKKRERGENKMRIENDFKRKIEFNFI